MLALDSNILLRHLLQDDPKQSPLATKFLNRLSAEAPGYISIVVLCEVVWSLRTGYRIDKPKIVEAIQSLLAARQIVVAHELVVRSALKTSGDLVDSIVHELGLDAGCSETITFDRKFARAKGVPLLSA